MEKSVKIILYVIIALVVINFLVTFFDNSNIRGIRDNLEAAKRSTDSALNELQISRSQLDSIQSDIVVFKSYINNVQKRVALADAEKRLQEEKDKQKVIVMRSSIDSLKHSLQQDSLPPIGEIPIKKN